MAPQQILPPLSKTSLRFYSSVRIILWLWTRFAKWKTRQHMKDIYLQMSHSSFKSISASLFVSIWWQLTPWWHWVCILSDFRRQRCHLLFRSLYKFPRHDYFDRGDRQALRSKCELDDLNGGTGSCGHSPERHERSHTDPNKRSPSSQLCSRASTFPHPAEAPFWFPSPRVTRLSTGCGRTPSRRRWDQDFAPTEQQPECRMLLISPALRTQVHWFWLCADAHQRLSLSAGRLLDTSSSHAVFQTVSYFRTLVSCALAWGCVLVTSCRETVLLRQFFSKESTLFGGSKDCQNNGRQPSATLCRG